MGIMYVCFFVCVFMNTHFLIHSRPKVTDCAPSYLTDLCMPVSELASRLALRSACGELKVPRFRSALKQRRAFSVIGPSTWNELSLTLRLLPRDNVPSFCKLLNKTFQISVF